MVYAVERDPDYLYLCRERDSVRQSLKSGSQWYTQNGVLRLFKYMIECANHMSELESKEWEAQD